MNTDTSTAVALVGEHPANVVQAYIQMRQEVDGLTGRKALREACEQNGKNYNDSYLTRWRNAATPVPDPVVAWMQEQVKEWVYTRLGIKPGKTKIQHSDIEIISQCLRIPVKRTVPTNALPPVKKVRSVRAKINHQPTDGTEMVVPD